MLKKEMPVSDRLMKRWTKEDLDYLLKNKGLMTIERIAAKLGRNKNALDVKLVRLRKLAGVLDQNIATSPNQM